MVREKRYVLSEIHRGRVIGHDCDFHHPNKASIGLEKVDHIDRDVISDTPSLDPVTEHLLSVLQYLGLLLKD
jgi:hypothetical protein